MKKYVIFEKTFNSYFKNLIPEGCEVYLHCEDNIPKEAFVFTSKSLAEHISKFMGPDCEVIEI